MKKLFTLLILFIIVLPIIGQAQTGTGKPTNARYVRSGETASVSWNNPSNPDFSETLLFRSPVPIEEYFSYEAVEAFTDKVYQGQAENYQDNGLAANLPYYYILFSRDQNGNTSPAVVLSEENNTSQDNEPSNSTNSLAGVSSEIVNQVSLTEAGLIYNYNQPVSTDVNTGRLALFIIAKSPHDLKEQDKNAISYFVHEGTPTTILLGAGERTGVLNSYLSVFEKLPRNQLEWQDIVKIANGRWPDQRNKDSEDRAADTHFAAIYQRQPNMDSPFDSAAVTVIAYGLRPANRNMESEKNAIIIYRSIFNRQPTEATDWDLVRAIAYSGATR